MIDYLKRLEELYSTIVYDKPVLKSDITIAEDKLLCTFNEKLIKLLTYSNGIKGEYFIPILYSLEEITKCNINFRTNSIFTNTYKPFNDLLFFLDTGNGDYFGFSIEKNVCKDEVFVWNHENDSRKIVSDNLLNFLYEWGNGDISI